MPFTALLTTSQIPASLLKIGSMGIIAFIFGEELGGINGGVAGAIAGMLVGVIGQILSHRALMKRQGTEGAVTLDQERDKVMERANLVHQQEVEFLRRAHQQEMDFLRRQVTYHENLELVTRKRLHAVLGEVQRCVLHIRLAEQDMIKNKLTPPAFVIKNFQDIAEMYPLPDSPQTPPSDRK